MNKIELKILQEQYDTITAVIDTQKKAQNILKKQGKDAGLRLKCGKFVADEIVYGVFYDLAYYSHFDGHKSGAVVDYASGAGESSEKSFNYIKNAIETGNIVGEEEMFDALQEVPFDECGYYEIPNCNSSKEEIAEFLAMFEIVSPTEIGWTYAGSGDQGEYYNGVGFTIKQATQSEIKKVTCKSYTETD